MRLLSMLGRVSNERIMEDPGVSRKTLRRDLLDLEKGGAFMGVPCPPIMRHGYLRTHPHARPGEDVGCQARGRHHSRRSDSIRRCRYGNRHSR